MVHITRVYTKTGDKGITSIAKGHSLSKAGLRIDTMGSIDELAANLALAYAQLPNEKRFQKLLEQCQRINQQLFNLGAQCAVLPEDRIEKTPLITQENITWLEETLDDINDTLESLSSFVLPGGNVCVAQFHVTRTVCRRAERRWVSLLESEPNEQDNLALIYLNRLSDWLFVMARWILKEYELIENLWDPKLA